MAVRRWPGRQSGGAAEAAVDIAFTSVTTAAAASTQHSQEQSTAHGDLPQPGQLKSGSLHHLSGRPGNVKELTKNREMSGRNRASCVSAC